MSGPRWEHFEHLSDIGIRGWGRTIGEAFEQAALAMTAVVTEPGGVSAREMVSVECQADDRAQLLADWLNAWICEMSARRMLFGRYEVQVAGGQLKGRAWGELVDVRRHRPTVEIKAATYALLAVRQEPTGEWMAQAVLDV